MLLLRPASPTYYTAFPLTKRYVIEVFSPSRLILYYLWSDLAYDSSTGKKKIISIFTSVVVARFYIAS